MLWHFFADASFVKKFVTPKRTHWSAPNPNYVDLSQCVVKIHPVVLEKKIFTLIKVLCYFAISLF